jgi:hypothetical protein
MINYIIYGNTDYLDVLEIQTDHMVGRGHLTLFINKNDLQLDILYSKYDDIIFYDNNDQYAKRLLTCLNAINQEYFILIHDIDILLNVDNNLIKNFYDFLKFYDYDRVDLKYSNITESDLIFEINENEHIQYWKQIQREKIDNGVYLIGQNKPNNYIYNVNPSIWKKESLIEILANFTHKTYRTIEEIDVQKFCLKFKVFKLYSNEFLKCGYFDCLNLFKFLHISHSGKLLPLNESFTTIYGQSYCDISGDYTKIIDKYNLKASNKWIN